MNHTVFSFNSGEVTPYLRHRIDFDKTESSAETMRNFIPNVYGGVTKRPGLTHVQTLTNCTINSRALPFVASTGAKFILHFTPGSLSIYNAAGALVSRLAFLVGYGFPLTDNFDDSLRQLQLVQLNDIAYIVHPKTHPLKLTYYGDTAWLLEFIDFSRAPMSNSNLDQTRRLSVASNPVAPGWNESVNYGVGMKVFTTSEWVCVVQHNAALNTKPGEGQFWTTYWRRNFYREGEAITLLGTNLSEVGWAQLYAPYAVNDVVTTGSQIFVSTSCYSITVRRWVELPSYAASQVAPAPFTGGYWEWAGTQMNSYGDLYDSPPSPDSVRWQSAGSNTFPSYQANVGQEIWGRRIPALSFEVNFKGPGFNGSLLVNTSKVIIVPAVERYVHIRWRRNGDLAANAPVLFYAVKVFTPELRILINCVGSGGTTTATVLYDFPDSIQESTWGDTSPNAWVDKVPLLVAGTAGDTAWRYNGDSNRPYTWKCIQAIDNFTNEPPPMSGTEPASNNYWRAVDMWFYRGITREYAVNDLVMGSGTILGGNPRIYRCILAHKVGLVENLNLSPPVVAAADTCPFNNVNANSLPYTLGDDESDYWEENILVPQTDAPYGNLIVKNWVPTVPFGVGRRISHINQIWYATTTHYPTQANAPGQVNAPWSLQPTAGLQSNFIGNGRSPGLYYKLSPKRDSSDFQITLNATQANNNLVSTPIAVQGEWFIYTYGTWIGTFQIEASDNNGETYQVIRSFQANADRNVADGGTSTYPVLLRLRWYHGGTGSSDPRAVLIPSNDGITGYALMDTYVGASAMTGIAKTTMVSGSTSDWAEGAFTPAKGFPKAIALHESRLVFGGTTANPVSLWLSRSNDFTNFETGVLDDSAIFATLSISNSSPITWIGAQRRLFVGTKFAEWQVGSESQDAPITPLNFVARQYSSYGSSPFQPLTAGDAFLFFEKNGAKIRDFSFDNNSQGYSGADICRLAEHLFQVGASNMAWQQNREPGLWVVRRDGVLLHMIYAKTDKVMAWSRHDTFNANAAGAFVNQGLFLDVVIFGGNGTDDDIYFVVRRTAGNVTTTRLERFQADWQRLMETGGGIFTDGNELVPVRAELKSLPIDAQSRDGSTSLAYRKRVHKASISLVQSKGGFLYNTNIANKQAITGTTLTNGWVDVVPDGGSLDDLQLNIEHSTAQPFLLRAAVIRYKTNER